MDDSLKSRRGSSNSNQRGNSSDRRARKKWVLETFGDGKTAPCFLCKWPMHPEQMEIDRIIPDFLGGTYKRDNIRPACPTCNKLAWLEVRQMLTDGIDRDKIIEKCVKGDF